MDAQSPQLSGAEKTAENPTDPPQAPTADTGRDRMEEITLLNLSNVFMEAGQAV
ncbi:hypothetical protein [Paenibacillus chitinolyticus]|uniref:Uncharacterized protein n=1 Tax=Paenibacillus chitinolyticus TaxID=79263 RepID=A0ABT4FD89_9BACL|nr:hypothetical protein [Paenibacillus chitinolyticus]MCY9590533.1 hypothetical protein [Paenibacillus chitinolyticus]MCY9596472.1 hypothetical protein [Paenibacillus chitinolyticus]